jgi:hypothetical protein
MMQIAGISQSIVWFIATAVALASSIASVQADEPLRWRFQPGQTLSYSLVQEMTISGGGAGGELRNTASQQFDITWEVQSVSDAGDALIWHRFDRIRSKMTLPTGGLEYDSATPGPPTGMAAINAPLYRALIERPVEISVAADGRITEVKIPDEVRAALKKVPTSAVMGDFAMPETFRTQFLSGFPTLPEGPIEPGREWSTKSTTELPAAGSQTVETTYRYEGTREVDGKPVALIKLGRVLSFAGEGPNRRAVKEQIAEGEALFDRAGRLHSTKLKHNVTIEANAGDRRAVQRIEQSIEVKQPAPK